MNITDERETTNTTFGKLDAGAVFLCPDFYDEATIFMKMGEDDNNVIDNEVDPDEGWLAVDLKNGNFAFFSDDILVAEVRANLTIR